jgi:hypothetical protein
MTESKVPRALYGPHADGLGDPERLTPGQRKFSDEEVALAVRGRRTSRSPLVRRLQSATDRALGRR